MKLAEKPSILGLTKAEISILKHTDSPISTAELSRLTEIPRSSLVYMIESLSKRKLLKTIKNKKRILYTKTPITEIQQLSNAIPQFFDPSLSVFTLPTFEDVRLYKGIDAIMDIHLETIASAPIGSHVKGMQPSASLIALFDNTPVEYVIEFNKFVTSRKVILEGIIEDGMYKKYEDYWKVDPESSKRLTPTFGKRTTDYVSVPDGTLHFKGELWIYLDVVLVTNWSEKTTIHIKNEELRSMFESLFNTCKAMGNQINHHIELEKISKE